MKTLLPLLPVLALAALPVRADMAAPAAAPTTQKAVIPTADFEATRYESLWKKSPFSVATPDGPTDTSPDYALYGIANIEGITYASLVDAHTNEHFLVSSDKAVRGITLNGITHQPNSTDIFANVVKDGQPLTLKLATAPTPAAATPNASPGLTPQGAAPGSIVPNIIAPGSGPGGGAFGNNSARPFPRIHRPHITLPPSLPPQPAPAPAAAQTPPPAPAPAH